MKKILSKIEKVLLYVKARKIILSLIALSIFTFAISLMHTNCSKEKLEREIYELKEEDKKLDNDIAAMYKELYTVEKAKQADAVSPNGLAIEAFLIYPTMGMGDPMVPDILPFMPNVHNRITQFMGMRVHPITLLPDYHKGVDVVTERDGYIISTMNGYVSDSGWDRDYGNYVIVSNGLYQTLYAHLLEYYVTNKEIVQKGQIIGRQGSTGLSNGAHTHYEIRVWDEKAGQWICVDPFKKFFTGYLSQEEFQVVNNIYLKRGYVSDQKVNRKK